MSGHKQSIDQQAERWVVGAILTGRCPDGSSPVDHLGDLETCDFADERHQRIVRATLDLRDAGKACGIAEIADELVHRGELDVATGHTGVGFLTGLMDAVPEVWHLTYWADQVRTAARRRDALDRASEIAGRLREGRTDAIELADAAERLTAVLKGDQRNRPGTELLLRRVSDVIEEPLKPLWQNRVYKGKLNLLCGDPGKGKSMLTADMAARFSIGADWPDGAPSTGPGSVIFFSAEDDVADTILPRLKRAGADLSRIYCMETVSTFNAKTGRHDRASFALGEHVPLLESEVKKIGDVGLIVIDPVSSYGGKVDSHKNGDVRGMLQPLTDLAAKYGIAILCVTHLSKGSGGKAVYRATGSLAYAAASRSVWMLAEDFDDKSRRLLLPVKINIAKSVPGLAFRIEGGMDETPFICWEANTVEMTADEFLAGEAKQQDGNGDDGALAKAVAFLEEQLKCGPVLSKELDDARKAHDISVSAIRRARESLGTKAVKTPEGWWTLLASHTVADIKVRTQGAQTPCHQILEHVEHLEHVDHPNHGDGLTQMTIQESQDAQGVQENGDTGSAHLDAHVAPKKRRKRKPSPNVA